MTETDIRLINLLKEVIKPPEQPPQDDLLKTLTSLKEAGIVVPRDNIDEAAVIEKLKAMKDALGLRFSHETEDAGNDMMNTVEEVQNLIDAIRPFTPQREKPSVVPAIIEVAGRFGLPLLATLNDLVSISRMNSQCRLLATPPSSTGQREEADRVEKPNHEEDETLMEDTDALIRGPGAEWCESMGIKVK